MPRYGINVRYADSPYDKVMPAIGDAIGLYEQEREARRQEQNTIAAQGGVAVGAPPVSRAAKIGNFIRKKVLGQTDPGAPPAPPEQAAFSPAGTGEAPVTSQMPAVAGYTQPGGASRLGGAPPRRIGDAIVTDPSLIQRGPGPLFPGGTPPFAGGGSDYGPPDNPVVRSGPGNQPPPPNPIAAPASGSIGDALRPYTITARGGQQYQIDPNRAANAARATKRGEMQDELDIKSAESRRTQQEQIQALTDAGMSPAVARAKVLNNVVKYDETYGQQHSQMTQRDRLAVQDRIDARLKQQQSFALQLEQMRQQGRTGTREFQQLTAQLRAMAQDDANDRAILSADETAAGRADRAVTTLQTNPVVAATPAGQAAIKDAQGAAAAAGAKAAESRARVAGKPPTSVRMGGKKATITQSQYDAARAKINPATKQPYTDAEIMQHYNIDPSVKRK